MLRYLQDGPVVFLAVTVALLVAITVHEFAHAWTAVRLGDPTPRLQKRLTLNPLAHLDLMGTVMLFLIGFGWGKPVQFDPYNLENPRRDAAIISIAGPISNLIMASLFSIILRVSLMPFSPIGFLSGIIPPFIILNIVLAVFNLVPVHPLDGGKILVGLLPHKEAVKADYFMNRYGIIILFFLIFPIWGGGSPVFAILSPLINFLMGVYIPTGLYV